MKNLIHNYMSPKQKTIKAFAIFAPKNRLISVVGFFNSVTDHTLSKEDAKKIMGKTKLIPITITYSLPKGRQSSKKKI